MLSAISLIMGFQQLPYLTEKHFDERGDLRETEKE